MMIISISCAILFLSNLFIFYKYKKLKNGLKEYLNIGTGRYGFYNYICNYSREYSAIVYVKEIDRYTNGYSKIKIDNIEPVYKNYLETSIEKANEHFVSLKLTADIDWLESEDYIRKTRKEKLDKLKKI